MQKKEGPMTWNHQKTDEEYIEKIRNKNDLSKKRKTIEIIRSVFGQILAGFLLFVQFYSIKRIASADIPHDTLFLTGIAFSASVISLFFFNIAIFIHTVKIIYGDRTELLLLKYYHLCNNNQTPK